ncbi:MAG: helix-turn-helix domain-containing protein [Bifidobacterium aquikefiri]|uniref:YodB n=1 Tax=Bifidobacterium aquikefiri TaxID=1653207 RepID=A0A261G730_9BIFI|nr:helix-turn-helix domain-containing protein [Bifidobacterium aquikefiri]OZG67240.1 YodB [Bifidobacterium aquikefiri]
MLYGEASVSYVRSPSIACDGFLAAVDIIDRRWSSVVIQAIAKGCRTFSQISCYSNKLNDSSLSKRLKELEDQGIVKRTVVDTRPPRAMYHLTQSGLELVPILDALTDWGNRNLLDQPDSSSEANP